jgi:hypothetical protein
MTPAELTSTMTLPSAAVPPVMQGVVVVPVTESAT